MPWDRPIECIDCRVSNWGQPRIWVSVTVCHLFSVRGKYFYSSLLFKEQVFQFSFDNANFLCMTCTSCKHDYPFPIYKSTNTFILWLNYRMFLIRSFLLLYVQWQIYQKSILIILINFWELLSEFSYSLKTIVDSVVVSFRYMPGLLSQT